MPEHHDVVRTSLDKVRQTGEPVSYETKLDMAAFGTPGAPTLWFVTKVVPIKVEGALSGYILIASDITAHKQAEAELERLAERLARTNRALEQSNRVKTEFMATVTHELRTPLHSVIGFAGLLKDEVPGPLNAKQTAFAADILAAGQHLLVLVEGILEMSRLDADGAELGREPVEIGAALQECLAAHRAAAEARGVTIGLDVVAKAGSAQLDPKGLRRMLDALIGNAIKFNREGGTVAVSARRTGGALEIAVADTGIGIAAEDLAKLFKPLVQLDAGLARRQGGIGLGLALARRLAELHGGTIKVESEPGKGSTFTLRLPGRHTGLPAFG
jgi:signal transduction histidine kinase